MRGKEGANPFFVTHSGNKGFLPLVIPKELRNLIRECFAFARHNFHYAKGGLKNGF
jgi:hypothetical protein